MFLFKYLIFIQLFYHNFLILLVFSNNISTRGGIWPNNCNNYPSVASFCYLIIEEVSYPYKCPYKDVAPFNKLGNVVKQFDLKFWINVHEDPDYGYYKWNEIGDDYGKLFSEISAENGECILTKKNKYETSDCNIKNTAICAYPVSSSNIKNFCDAYNEICGETNCHCKNKKGFFCETSCENSPECSLCEQKFNDYPNPKITLQLEQKNIIVTVDNILKLYHISKDHVIYCYTDIYEPSESLINYRYKDYELSSSKINEDTIKYQFKIKDNLEMGKYWCEGFLYPDLNPIQSNIITTGDNSYLNFVLNVTINLTSSSYKKLPFNYHTKTLEIIKNHLNVLIRPIDLSKIYFNKQRMNVIFQISTKQEFIDVETIYNQIWDDLSPIINLEEIICYELLNEEYEFIKTNCLNDITTTETSLTTISSTIETTSSIIETTFSTIETTSSRIETTSSTIETIPSTIETIPSTTETIPLTTETIPSTTEIIPSTIETTSSIIQTTTTEIIPTTIKTTPQTTKTTPLITETTLSSEITSQIIPETPPPIKSLHDLFISNKTSTEKNEALFEILSTEESFTSYDIHFTAEIFQQIVMNNQIYDLDLLVENLNAVTKINRETLFKSQQKLNSTDSLLYTFDVALSDSSPKTIIKENIILQIVDLKTGIIGMALYKENNKLKPIPLNQSVSIETIERENLIFATYIPKELLKEILDKTPNNEELNLVITTYLNDALFNDNTKTNVEFVVSMFIVGFNSISLDYLIPIIFENDIKGEKNCAFWNYGIDETLTSFSGYWKIDNKAYYNKDTKTCKFSHMTHFALLVGAEEDPIINYLSTIGAILTLISVLLMFLTALFSKTWRESSGTKILLNFSIAIALQMIILIATSIIKEKERSVCIILGISLHYVVISQFCWALVISYLQYRKFVEVLVQEPSYIVLKSSIFAWGISLIPVLISTTINIDNYIYNNICYPSGYYLHFGLYLPIMIIISINISMFVLIFRNVLNKKTNAVGTEKNIILLRLKLGVILFFLMGFSWIFGLLGSFFKSNVLLYIFCFTTSIQGFVLYIYFVVWNKSTRRVWKKQLRKARGSRSEEDNKTSTTSQSDYHNKKY